MITTCRLPLAFAVFSLALIAGHGVAQIARPALEEPAVAPQDDAQPNGNSSLGQLAAPEFAPPGATFAPSDAPALPYFDSNAGTLGSPSPAPASPVVGPGAEAIQIQYTIRRPVTEEFRGPDGKAVKVLRFVVETQSAQIDKDQDLEKLDLPPEGKRAAVLAVTAARHAGLLEKLKAAKTAEEKQQHSLALKENYTAHYAIETWWREQKLAELEARLTELRAQVTQRQESEEKYIAAAMTIAELWAEGIGITPPIPNRLPSGQVPSAAHSLPAMYQPVPSAVSPLPSVYPPNPSNAPATPSLPGPESSSSANPNIGQPQTFAPTLTPAKAPASATY